MAHVLDEQMAKEWGMALSALTAMRERRMLCAAPGCDQPPTGKTSGSPFCRRHVNGAAPVVVAPDPSAIAEQALAARREVSLETLGRLRGSGALCSRLGCDQQPEDGAMECEAHGRPLSLLPGGAPTPTDPTRCVIAGCAEEPFLNQRCREHFALEEQRLRDEMKPPKTYKPLPARVACSVSACGRAVLAAGYCSSHYTRWRRILAGASKTLMESPIRGRAASTMDPMVTIQVRMRASDHGAVAASAQRAGESMSAHVGSLVRMALAAAAEPVEREATEAPDDADGGP